MMTKFYLSPNDLSFKQYSRLVEQVSTFGWKPSFVWPHKVFEKDLVYDQVIILKMILKVNFHLSLL